MFHVISFLSSSETNEGKDGKEKLGLGQEYSLLQRFDRMSSLWRRHSVEKSITDPAQVFPYHNIILVDIL